MEWLEKDGSLNEGLRSMINSAGDLVFIKNLDFVYLAASKSFSTICARCKSSEELIGKTDFDLFPESLVRERYRRDDEILLASGKTMMEFQEDFIDSAGKKYPCYTAKYVLRDANGKPQLIFGQYHRVGQEMQDGLSTEARLLQKSSEALMRTFFVSNYVDLRTHAYRTLFAMDYVQALMTPGESAEEGFESFFQHLVKPEFIPQLREFCDLTTLAERLRDKAQIDCVYLSKVALGWCRVMFFPTEWDADGNLTHVLFTVSSLDEKLAQDLDEGRSNKKDLENLINAVPGGIVLYEWDGNDLNVLRMSKYYRDLYGDSMLNHTAVPDYQRIHPDDLADYRRAIAEALATTHQLEYVFRVWNPPKERYTWTQIHALSSPQPDGTSLVYAIYTDITEQKEAELESAKQQASLEVALAVSNQVCCEYDPQNHTVSSFTKKNIFSFPPVLQDFPECMQEFDFLHPEDLEKFQRTVHQADDGKQETHCDVRAKVDGVYCWFSCQCRPYYDVAKERTIVIMTFVDVSVRINALRDYETRMQTMLTAKGNTLSMCAINLSRDIFTVVGSEKSPGFMETETGSFSQLMVGISNKISDETVRDEYLRLFSQDSLQQRARDGRLHTEMEFLADLAPGHREWVTVMVDLVHNPLTNEYAGIAYSMNTQSKHMSQELLQITLQQDYLLSSIIMVDTDEFYLYEGEHRSFGMARPDFWNSALQIPQPGISEQTREYLSSMLVKERMLAELDANGEFCYAYDGLFLGQELRMELCFRYLDAEHSMILAVIRDITDRRLQEQWKYDSEHDALTGLYNRKTVFKRCRQLLTEHPEESFRMIHCDVRRFHLYNTFFGEKTGDDLLKRMAAVIRLVAADYDLSAYGRIESDVFCFFVPVRGKLLEKQIRESFDALAEFSPEFPLRLSIGVYEVTDPAMSIEEMFTRATIAAKSGATNLFGLIAQYDEAMDQELRNVQDITKEMKGAIANEQFEVYLQPKFELESKKMVGAEALVRWNHPTRGLRMPGMFIPVFEQNGFIAELDRYMWEHVCRILRTWKEEGKTLYPISVNMSRVSMYNPATVPLLKGLAEKYEIDPAYLEIELTETAYMDDPEELKQMLLELQAFGFKILMDDFGSGYSSLNTLRELPVDVLKLDMKFLLDLQEDPRGVAVLSSVVNMSKLLNLPIVAEGVERPEQAEHLLEIGCEYVQGFLFAKPMPVPEFVWLME